MVGERQEKLNTDGAGTKGQLELGEYEILTGYVAFYGENNLAGEPVLKEGLVLRNPKWLATEIDKDELGVTMVVMVPKADMPKAEPDLNVAALEREVAELKAQLLAPLSPSDVTFLKGVVSAEKVKLGDSALCMQGLELIEKLNGFLNPKLNFDKKEPESETEEGEHAEGPSNPEADAETTEE